VPYTDAPLFSLLKQWAELLQITRREPADHSGARSLYLHHFLQASKKEGKEKKLFLIEVIAESNQGLRKEKFNSVAYYIFFSPSRLESLHLF